MPAIVRSNRFDIRAFARQHQGARSVAVSLGLHAALGAALVLWFTIPRLQEPEERVIEVAFDHFPARLPEPKQELPKVEPEREIPKNVKPREPVRTPPVPFDGPQTPPAPPPAGPAAPSGAGAGTAPMLAPAPTYRVNPVFPARAQEREREGVAEVVFVVGADGAVTQLQLLSESPEGFGFGASAMAAVGKWRFATAQPGLYRVTVRFRLN